MDNPNKRKQNIAGAVVAVVLTVMTFYVTDFQRITIAANSAYDSINTTINVGDETPTTKG